jgi:hypothetical protein
MQNLSTVLRIPIQAVPHRRKRVKLKVRFTAAYLKLPEEIILAWPQACNITTKSKSRAAIAILDDTQP